MMSPDQLLAFDAYKQGLNVFLTGPGGTGKSKLIRNIYEDALQNERQVQVCALTGCAALLLECSAKTIHSWSGIGILKENVVERVLANRYAEQRWQKVDVLIVDEVSMMAAELFDALDELGKHFRGNRRPFGGIQLLFSGDFFQLPPVELNFCFESPRWVDTFHRSVVLTTMFRQKNQAFQAILNQLRVGQLSKSSYNALLAMVREGPAGVTQLVPTRAKAEDINGRKYAELATEERTYTMAEEYEPVKRKRAEDPRRFSSEQVAAESKHMRSNVRCEEKLKLKVGTQVMCVVNQGELCNGSQGVVVRFFQGNPVVKFKHGEEVVSPFKWKSENVPGVTVSQVPLVYAWAITIHKSQGATLDYAQIDAGSEIFACGQIYTALSRVRDAEGVFLSSFDKDKIKVNRKVCEFNRTLSPTLAPVSPALASPTP
jgi:ATP-dependent DNA helicase PIF1